MTLKTETVHSISRLLAASDAACVEALERGLAVDLVVPNVSWRDRRKLMLRTTLPAGVNVQTYDEWVEGLWELYGDGRRIVSGVQRRVLLRPLCRQARLLPGNPSARFLAELGDFVVEAIAPGAVPTEKLDDARGQLAELVDAYAERLDEHGLIERAQAEHELAAKTSAGHAVVLENVDLESPHRQSFVRALGKRLPVTEVDQQLGFPGADESSPLRELDELRGKLYTGEGGVRVTSAVRVGEARGAHAAGAVLCELVKRCLAEGAAPSDVAVVFPSTAESYPHAQLALAQAGIPFSARFSLPASRTPFGAAFSQLMNLRAAPDAGNSYEWLAGFIATPYAGIAGADARALQMRWRERAGSTPEERLADVVRGFSQGNANAKATKERLLPLAGLLDAETAPSDCARLMFAHAQASRLDADSLVDDRAAAEAVLDYLAACDQLGAAPDPGEIAELPVALERGFGDVEDAVLLSDADSVQLAGFDHLVVTGLDAGHYPMARQAGPFDTVLDKFGIAVPDTTVFRQRILLLNLIESAGASISFSRATHDAQGVENVQSALWDELMTAYRTEADEDDELPVEDIPAALRPFAVRLSEAGVFARGADEPAASRPVVRGHLARAGEVELLSHDLAGKEMPFSPTGLEDYYRCPYRWFACRRVGYNGMDNEFDAAAQGNLAHATMERFYRELKAQGIPRVTPENLDAALDLVSRALDEQVEHDEGRNRGGLFLRTEQDRCEVEEIRAMLADLVRRDASFLPGFEPTYFELTLGKGTGTMLEYAGVPVRGKVDRIDVDGKGNAVIIDYKLSGLTAGYGLDPDHDVPGRIQTDIYARLVQEHFDLLGVPLRVVGSVYRSYSKNCLRGAWSRSIDWGPEERVSEKRDALPREGRDESYEEYLAHVEDTVAGCMKRLHEGHIEPAPLDGDTKNICEYCKALPFCPVGGK